ncbi:hypothetical protein SmJEL517_g02169 [Synchytrium microbalum]|uniref:ABC transporter domain-containing protein n=1 Tax=Synchytrium microbalum TaxID=1806994 RepID=A0A507CC40_9FUNG|nr:uncharacterized protein SmJEL517_g02169 [Synchytrium microbalum]TPX35586.1 hypothetical protein SmJEL517_g02169 [Synchytrium microbalum]
MSFRAMLRQEMAFFDEDKNSTGVLTTRLGEDASLVRGLTGQTLSLIIQGLSAVCVGMGIAFANGWQLTLVILAIVPLISLAGQFQFRVLNGFDSKTKLKYQLAGQIATEAIENIRTVAALNKEDYWLKRYLKEIDEPYKLAVRGALISAIGYGFSQGMGFVAYIIGFLYGGHLVVWGVQSSQSMLQVLFAVTFTAQAGTRLMLYTPDFSKAKLAALSIFDLVDRRSRIDYTDGTGKKPTSTEGVIAGSGVQFTYPSRPDAPILKGLDVAANKGQVIALVGPSGSGKSTIVGLLERWYDVDAGLVTVDGIDVRDWNLSFMREQMSMVGQEPVLPSGTIRDNIAYGAPWEATQAEIEAAAKTANIHDFVMKLPDGYDTMVGERGSQLSGGQKQRVAIARALIRNPKILLLDEATSALDSESEKLVQEALDKAVTGRTTITIAHRLSTIQNANKIYVIRGGVVVETGTHFELLALGGDYANLVEQQMLTKEGQSS